MQCPIVLCHSVINDGCKEFEVQRYLTFLFRYYLNAQYIHMYKFFSKPLLCIYPCWTFLHNFLGIYIVHCSMQRFSNHFPSFGKSVCSLLSISVFIHNHTQTAVDECIVVKYAGYILSCSNVIFFIYM